MGFVTESFDLKVKKTEGLMEDVKEELIKKRAVSDGSSNQLKDGDREE